MKSFNNLLLTLVTAATITSCNGYNSTKKGVEEKTQKDQIGLLEQNNKDTAFIKTPKEVTHISDIGISIPSNTIKDIRHYLGNKDSKKVSINLEGKNIMTQIYKHDKLEGGLYIVLKGNHELTQEFYIDQDIELDKNGTIRGCGGIPGSTKEIAENIVNITNAISEQIENKK